MLDSMAEGVIVADRNGAFLHWNPAAQQILGSAPPSLERDAWSARYGVFLPDGVTPFPTDQIPLLRATRGEHVDDAEGIVRHAGRPEGVVWTASARPLRNDAGELLGGLVVFRDVTAERRTEQQRRESEERFRKLFENGPLGMALVDLDARFVHVNDRLCELTGYTVEELGTLGLRDIVQASAASPDDGTIAGVLSGAVPYLQANVQYRPKDGTTRWATLTGSVVRTEAAVPLYGVVTLHDVTDRTRAEQAAQQHREELARVLRLTTAGEMASGLAHELNQPLCAIANFASGCVRRLDDGVLDAAQLRYGIERMAAESQRAGQIIHRVLNFVRKRVPNRQGVDLNHVVREAASLVEADARQQKVALELILDPDLPPVTIDTIQIEQVIINLLRNAVEAMTGDAGPRTVHVRTAATGPDAVEVSVEDTGHGIPAEVGARIFEPFFTTKSAGLGMGLSISTSIIEAHGGRIGVASTSDRGSTFRFTLPREAAADVSPATR
jgi:PAS domain S-box-containing protein